MDQGIPLSIYLCLNILLLLVFDILAVEWVQQFPVIHVRYLKSRNIFCKRLRSIDCIISPKAKVDSNIVQWFIHVLVFSSLWNSAVKRIKLRFISFDLIFRYLIISDKLKVIKLFQVSMESDEGHVDSMSVCNYLQLQFVMLTHIYYYLYIHFYHIFLDIRFEKSFTLYKCIPKKNTFNNSSNFKRLSFSPITFQPTRVRTYCIYLHLYHTIILNYTHDIWQVVDDISTHRVCYLELNKNISSCSVYCYNTSTSHSFG